jgi:multiple sugar transport system substrate-binding protein
MSEDPVASGMQEVADAYNAAQPAIKVTITPQTSGYEDKLRAALAGGTPPEVARLNDDLIASYVCRGSCRPLEDYLTRARVKKDEFFSAQWRLPTVEGKTYAIVVGYTPQVVWVNAEHFQRAGLKVPTVPYKSDEWTWADFLDAARKMTAPPGPDGISPVYGTSALQSWYGYWVWGNGGEVLTPDKKKFGLALPSGYEALQWAADLINKHKVHPPMAYIRQPGLGALDLFAAGRLGMLAGGGNWATLRQRAAALNWDIVPYPKGKVRRGHTSTPLLFMVPTGTRHPDQAFTFLMHLVSDDAQKIVGAKGFRMPPKKAQANSSLFLRPDLPPKNQRLWLDAQEGALEEPQIPQREKLRQTYRPALEPVWAGTQTAQEAMKAVEAQCNAVLAEPCA